MEANPHLLVEIQSEEEDQGTTVETVRQVVVMEPSLRRSVAPPYEAPPDYMEVMSSVAAREFEAVTEDATREEEDEGERMATEEDLYAVTE